MNVLVIIGNGFDRAHNLSTSYNHFVEYLVNTYLEDKKVTKGSYKMGDLFTFKYNYKDFKDYKKKSSLNPYILDKEPFAIKNGLLRRLIKDSMLKNWCDIEARYYEYLNNPTCKTEKLNDEFSVIKNKLEY